MKATQTVFEANIPVNILFDERLVRIQTDYGMKGVGVLFSMFLFLEKYSWLGVNEKVLLGQSFCERCSRNMLHNLLYESGFFCIQDHGFISKPDYTHACTGTETDTDTMMHTDIPADIPADAPVDTPADTPETYKEPITNIPTAEAKEEVAADAADISYIKEILLEKKETLWRQTLLMQCPFGDQLKKFWTEAVGFFINHATVQANLDGLYNESEVRRYFARFVMGNNTATQRLRKYLSELEAVSQTPSNADSQNPFCFEDPVAPDGSRSYGGRPIPNNAPPRPSDKAEWNDAIEGWKTL